MWTNEPTTQTDSQPHSHTFSMHWLREWALMSRVRMRETIHTKEAAKEWNMHSADISDLCVRRKVNIIINKNMGKISWRDDETCEK